MEKETHHCTAIQWSFSRKISSPRVFLPFCLCSLVHETQWQLYVTELPQMQPVLVIERDVASLAASYPE